MINQAGALAVCILLAGCQAMHDPQRELTRLAATSWRLERIGDAPVAGEIETTVKFDEQSRVAGFGGCNPYVSDVQIEPDGVHFSKPLATEFSCTDEQTGQESRFFAALESSRTLRVEHDRLLLIDEHRKILARLRPVTFQMKLE